MIICFNNKINSFDEKNLKSFTSHEEKNSYIQSLMPGITELQDNVCPCCHAKKSLIKYGTYNRHFAVLNDNDIEDYEISVQRVICNSCGHTHALLPNFIVPYKIMAIFSIAKIVQSATITSAYKVAEITNLSVTIIYAYVALVLTFFSDFRVLNNSKEKGHIQNFNQKYFLTNCVELSNSNCRLDFFEFHNWFLFMQKFRNNPSPPITIFASKVLPT